MTIPTSNMDDYLDVLRQYKHIAVVGIADNPLRPSYLIAIYLQAEGYDIIPINPRYAGKTLLGKRVYATLTEAKEAGEQIEIVDVFRRAEDVPPIADETIAIGAKVLWLQLGIINDQTVEKAQQAGLIAVQNRCTKVEHARLKSAENGSAEEQ